MSVSNNNKNRGAHGDSSFMLGRSRPSSENPTDLSVESANSACSSCSISPLNSCDKDSFEEKDHD